MSSTGHILQHLWQEKPLLLGMPDTSQGYLRINSHWCYHWKRHTHNKKKSNFAKITLEGCQTRAMIDMSAEANVIMESQVPDKIRRLTKTHHIQLQPYDSKVITPKGEFTAYTHWRDKICKSTWIVVDDDDLPENPINLGCHATSQNHWV